MEPIVKELRDKGLAMQTRRPADMEAMRKRLGARDQNGSIALYAYADVGVTADILYYFETGALKDGYDFKTVANLVSDWLFFVADRIPRYYRFGETAELTTRVIEAAKSASSREELHEILKAAEYYYQQLRMWIDVEIPWAELGIAYAKAKGDPAPRDD
jgi:hypothetical protein